METFKSAFGIQSGRAIARPLARYRTLRHNWGGDSPPNKTAFGLQSGCAIARPRARYRELQFCYLMTKLELAIASEPYPSLAITVPVAGVPYCESWAWLGLGLGLGRALGVWLLMAKEG